MDLLIIMEFCKILVSLEQRYNAHGPTARVLKKYVIIVFAVIVSWTMLSNLPRDWQIGLLVLGAFLLFVVNIRLFFHVLSLRKHVKKKIICRYIFVKMTDHSFCVTLFLQKAKGGNGCLNERKV